MLLHRRESDVPHGYSKSVLRCEPGLLESNGAAECRLERKRRARSDMGGNEFLEFSVLGLAYRKRNDFVRGGVQLCLPVIGVVAVVRKIGQREHGRLARARRARDDEHSTTGHLAAAITL